MGRKRSIVLYFQGKFIFLTFFYLGGIKDVRGVFRIKTIFFNAHHNFHHVSGATSGAHTSMIKVARQQSKFRNQGKTPPCT